MKNNVSRKVDINVMLEIIKNRDEYKENSENGLIILLNGAWGSGKSTFLSELKEQLNKLDNMNLFLDYNAYDFDSYETPYIPFFASIEDKLNLDKDFNKLIKPTSYIGKGVLVTLFALINGKMKNNFDIDLNDIKDNLMGIENENYKKDFDDFVTCKEKIKLKLQKYCSEKLQIFIIDELDRCKPTFAIDTLEIIKHFFDVENCVFIISVDKLQLEESAKTIFGQEMDSEKYFSKFFDYQYNLLPINFYETVDTSNVDDLDKIIKEISKMFSLLNISLRDANKIFNEFVSKYKTYNNAEIPKNRKWTKQQCCIVTFLLTLKYTDLLFYTELMNGNYEDYKKKINNSNILNNYSKLYNYRVDGKQIYSDFLYKFSSNLDSEYLDINRIHEYYFNPTTMCNDFSAKQDLAKEMFNYIPQVEPNKTFKENVQKLIN